jgi:hypothetical protein
MHLIALTALLALTSPQGNSESIGSLPTPSLVEETVCSGSQKVPPGSSHTNGDGVTVENDPSSSGNATISPDGGGPNCASNVVSKSGFEGAVNGIDVNDTVALGSGADATVSGTGGSVSISGGSTVTVTNTNGPGGGVINVFLPSGNTATVGPGSSVTFNT